MREMSNFTRGMQGFTTQLFCSAGEMNLECVVFERFPFSVYGFKKRKKKLSPVDFTVPPGRSFG